MQPRKTRYNAVIFVALCLVLAAVTQFQAHENRRPAPVAAQKIADFTYRDMDGFSGNLYQFSQPVIVHFWATWCPPCVTELPQLIDKAKKTPGTIFLLVSVNKNKEDVTRFLQSFRLTAYRNIVLAHDPQQKIAADIFHVKAFPETFLLNADKTLKRHMAGPVPWVSFTDF